ncbi:MAG TPA: hypothetical protein VL426_06835 [Candidatus Binatia bacterium]|jgi:hypothetical protein|nr:hypothetical protein [Candidatus Binatia bacterium]
MHQDPLGSIGSVPVAGGNVRFTYDAQGNVIATFEDVAYKGNAYERFLHPDWRDAVIRATSGAGGDMHARQIALDDIVSTARIAEVHREAHEALASSGRLAAPEAAYLARSVIERLERIKAKYGDVVIMPGEEAAPSEGPTKTEKVPAGFEDTPRIYGPDGRPTGYDLSKGFVAPAGFKAWFTYGPDGSVQAFHADAKVGMDTLTRMLLRPDWNVVFEARVVEVTRRSWLGRILDVLRRRPKPEPEQVRTEMSEKFAGLLLTIFVDGQAVLGLERAGMGSAYETGFLRRAIDEAKRGSVELFGGRDVLQ